MKTITLVVALAACMKGDAAQAQSNDYVLAGESRARILAPTIQAERLAGRVLGRDSTTLYLLVDYTTVPTSIPFSAITSVERSLGRRRGKWAAAGFGLGLVGGVALGTVVAMSDDGRHGGANLAPLGFGFFGMIGGAVGGALAAPERWVPVTAPIRSPAR